MAGDVQRVSPSDDVPLRARWARRPRWTATSAGFREESFFEYHLYTLDRPTDVLQNEQKQVTLLEAKGATLDKKLIFYGQQYWYRGPATAR